MPRPFTLSPEQQADVIRRYQNKERVVDIAKIYSVSHGTIYYALKQNGIKLTVNFHNLSSEEIEKVKQLYSNGLTSYQIADIFGVSRPAISTHLRNKDRHRKTRSEASRKYTFNENYFENITTGPQAYWLGMLAADGCVRAGNQITLALQSTDKELLNKFANSLEATNPISHYKYNRNNIVAVDKCIITFTSNKMAKDLLKYNITPRKTFTLDWPDIPFDLYCHFIRGLTDGDGTFCVSARNNIGYSILGTENLMTKTRNILAKSCNLQIYPLIEHPTSKGIFRFRYEGNHQVIRIANYLYGNNVSPYLDRKREKVLNHYHSLPKYKDLLEFC